MVHTGEKPFQCAVCGNRLVEDTNLITYLMDYHLFLRRFTQPANLRTHVKKRHNYNVEGNKQNKCK